MGITIHFGTCSQTLTKEEIRDFEEIMKSSHETKIVLKRGDKEIHVMKNAITHWIVNEDRSANDFE